jgi:hypothetical protein
MGLTVIITCRFLALFMTNTMDYLGPLQRSAQFYAIHDFDKPKTADPVR